jgi:alpha-D-ribose 1-methylphosphonate 5-triphosphate synthase subunit PhnG
MSEVHSSGSNGSAAVPAHGFGRAQWMSLLARSTPERLEALWSALDPLPTYRLTRPPEVALVMVRARAGGTGRRFNLGEATVTRCAVTTGQGILGIGYVRGRSPRHAELAAAFDAALQDPDHTDRLARMVLLPLQHEQERHQRLRAAETDATRVEFFTLVRGED